MKNTKIPMLALGLLAVSALGGTAYQVSAQATANQNTTPVVQNVVSTAVEQKDANETGTETKDVNDTVSASVLAQVKITDAQARQKALDANPNTTIKNSVVGDENGKAIYEIKLSNNIEVKIDAVTGSVLQDEQGDNEQGGDTVDQKDANGNDTETNDGADSNN